MADQQREAQGQQPWTKRACTYACARAHVLEGGPETSLAVHTWFWVSDMDVLPTRPLWVSRRSIHCSTGPWGRRASASNTGPYGGTRKQKCRAGF